MKKIVVSFCVIFVIVAILMVVKNVFAQDATITDLFNGMIKWAAGQFGVDGNIFQI